MAIDFDLLKEIKARADIVDVISAYLPSVQKKGRNYEALCPFHTDHDPSLKINKEKQIFNCFVCHTSGDVFSFVQKYEKCGFEEAVRKVCEIINFDDPRLHKQTYLKPVDENLVPLYGCINELQKLYVYALSTDEGKIARDYLDSRHLSDEQRKKFGLGYSLKDGKKTIEYLRQKGYSLKNIEDIGIALAQTQGMADHNSGRLIFPIHNYSGQVVGFSARRMNKDDDSPKYVNSPETKIFTKGNILYNYHNARQCAKHDGYLYIVEGFMDVFALDTIGITSCVALMGTKLTEQHIEMIRRLNVEIRLCLDCDKAGQESMMQILSQIDKAKISYRLVSMPGEERDPDEILKQDGEEKLKVFVNTLVDPFTFAMNYYKNTSPLGSIDDRKKVVTHFMPIILGLQSKLIQDDYLYKLSEVTGFSVGALKEQLKSFNRKSTNDTNEYSNDKLSFESKPVEKEYRRIEKAEKIVLEQMLNNVESVEYYEENIKYFVIEEYRLLANFVIEYVNAYPNEISPSLLMTYIENTDVSNKEVILQLLTKFTYENKNQSFNKEILDDCMNVIVVERDKISSRNMLRQALEGKTPQDQARLAGDYIAHTNARDKNKAK